MGPTLCSVVTLTILGVAIAIGLYLNWHCPQPSRRLYRWYASDSAYFNMKGIKLFYKDYNSKNKFSGNSETTNSETLLLLHGFPTSSYDWSKIWPTLTLHFARVVAPDFLGFGYSDKPMKHNYTIIEQADLVVYLLKAIQVEEFHILAHDYGDSVAQELLHRQNHGMLSGGQKIKSVCLLNGGVFKEVHNPTQIQKLLLTPVFGNLLPQFSNRYIYSQGLSQVFGSETKPKDDELYDFWCAFCMHNGYLNTANVLDYLNQRTTHNLRWRKALADATIPIHFIYGPADPVNPPLFIDFYKTHVPKGTIDVLDKDIGHYVQWEASDTVATLFMSFFQKRVA